MGLNSQILSIIVGILLVIAFILYTTSNVMVSWRTATVELLNVISIHGLWKSCVESGDNIKPGCVSISCGRAESSSNVCKRIIIGFILSWTCFITAILSIYFFLYAWKKESSFSKFLLSMKIITLISLIIGIITVIIGIIVTGDVITDNTIVKFGIGTAVYVAIGAIIINIIAVILGIFIK